MIARSFFILKMIQMTEKKTIKHNYLKQALNHGFVFKKVQRMIKVNQNV